MLSAGFSAVSNAANSAAAGAQAGLSGAQSKLQEAKDMANSGSYTQIGSTLGSYMKEKVDANVLQSAGFGAVGKAYHEKKMEARGALFDMSKPMRARMVFGLRESLKSQLVADPDMPNGVKGGIEGLVDLLCDDAMVYLETNVEDARLAAIGRVETDVKALGEIGQSPTPCTPGAFRAFMLYHLLPYDISIFGQFKDPIFWILTAVSLITFYGVRIVFFFVVFLMIMAGRPADEYQLTGYILAFKGTQFLSSGVCMAVMAAVRYYMCVLPDGTHTCAENGPGATQDIVSGAIDILGSCILVWAAFAALPFSVRSAGMRDEFGDAPQDEKQTQRGGRLARLLTWDLVCFALSLLLLAAMTYFGASETHKSAKPDQGEYVAYIQDSWQFRTSVFFARVFYSILSFPFILFMIPGLNGVLTHTTATGYNRQGICVPFVLHPVKQQ
eukprot:TRINITY_DN28790_c0_g1_i1.p1 TRINITY_DN28790_c0_g1~~TRINITY_DN28790_c0_g1_i1.p1  ORF type:complete len:442 (-),score=56.74 TRINITY_DN28790_c0_g1_i1:338-1663(-)